MPSPYFNNKEKRKEKAKRHTAEMNQQFAKQTAESVYQTKMYGGKDGRIVRRTVPLTQRNNAIPITVDNLDSVASILPAISTQVACS